MLSSKGKCDSTKKNSEDLRFSFKQTSNRLVDPISLFKYLYNHERNQDGRYIKFVFEQKISKEGLDLFSTTYVHFLSPPNSISVYGTAISSGGALLLVSPCVRQDKTFLHSNFIL